MARNRRMSDAEQNGFSWRKGKREPNPYHPETCPPNCPRCVALQGAWELQGSWNVQRGAHLIACAVYDKPQGPCNCGKLEILK